MRETALVINNINITNNYASIDIDDCSTNNGGCEHICNNRIASYDCECRNGYILGQDLHDCIGKHGYTI